MSNYKPIYTSFYEDKDYFAEELYNPLLTPSKQFVLYDKADDGVDIVESFETKNGKTYTIVPLDLNLIDNGTVLLPSTIDNKSSEVDLDEKILAFVHKWLDIDEFFEQIDLYYIKMTWIYDRLSVVPYLRALGDYGSGKTRLIQTVGSLCYKPMFLAGATSDAYIFRVIELFKGTVVLNELERVNTDLSTQIVNILNNGYEKGMRVGRIEGDRTKTPIAYDVFSPKLISAREPFKDLALESRIITNRLYPTPRKDIPIAVDDSLWKEAEEIRNTLLGYRFKFISSQHRRPATNPQNGTEGGVAELAGPSLEGVKGQILYDLEPRLRQTLFPLLSVVPEDQAEKFAKFSKEYQQEMIEDRSFELEGVVAKALFSLLGDNAEVSVKELRSRVNAELDDDKFKITPQKIGKILKSWGLKTKPVGHDKIPYITNKETSFRRLRVRFGILDTPQESTASTADPQVEQEKETFLGQAEQFLNGSNQKDAEQLVLET